MHFGLNEEQTQLRDVVRGFLADLPGPRAVLEGAEAHDGQVWQRIVEEQGWQAILIPEDEGGFGFGWMELAVLFEELGRTLTPCPLLPTTTATAALLAADASDLRTELLEAIIAGTPASLALAGERDRVVGGADAQILVVEQDGALYALRASQFQATVLETLDITRPMARLRIDDLPDSARLTGIDSEILRAQCEILVACEAVGTADACLQMSVDYAKVREQFDTPIGSFQAIQHMCADMMVAVESARSAAWYAAWACDAGAEDQRMAARTAKATACDALTLCAGQNIQIHGGIGFTWEHDAHLYFKRARASLELYGAPGEHREAVASALLEDE